MNLLARQIFETLLAQRSSVYEKTWKGKPFEKIKYLAATEKGDLGEDFLAWALKRLGYDQVDTVKSRRGQYDVSVSKGDKTLFFEVKVASQDTNGNFQFNGIRYDTRYTHLFCLGVTPETLAYLLINKEALGGDDYRMVSMMRGANATFKLSRTQQQLKSFDYFADDLQRCFDQRSG